MSKIKYFINISSLGLSHFEILERDKVNIEIKLKMSTYFPTFVDDEENESLIEGISKEELNTILKSI